MIVERQGHNECSLATIAALLDQPLSRIREVALRAVPNYPEARRSPFSEGRNPAFRAIFREFDQDNILGEVREVFFRNVPPPIPTHDFTLPTVGRGIVTVSTFLSAHVFPFENGLVHDVDSPAYELGFVSLRDLMTQTEYVHWDVCEVVRTNHHLVVPRQEIVYANTFSSPGTAGER